VIVSDELYFAYPCRHSMPYGNVYFIFINVTLLLSSLLLARFLGTLKLLQLVDDGVDDLVGAALAAQIGSRDLAFEQDAVDGGVDPSGRGGVAQVGQEQCSGPVMTRLSVCLHASFRI
jgi:hypothetical protein